MKLNNLSKIQIVIFSLLICMSGVFGYLFYDAHKTNMQNREMIADTKIDNKDLSEDLAIMKDKYDRLHTEVDQLKTKVAKVSYKKKYHKQRRLYSAGRSSKYKHSYKRYKVNYKKLYMNLRKTCKLSKRTNYYSAKH